MDLIAVRLLFVIFVAVTCYLLQPFGLASQAGCRRRGAAGQAIVIFEWRLHLVSLKRLIGAAIGSVLGIFGAYLFALVIRNSIPAGHTAELPANHGHVADGLCRPDCRRQQRRSAEPGGAGRGFRRREAIQEELQNSGHQRHYRWPHCRHRRDRIPRWNHRNSTICVARTATGRRLGRFAQA